MTSPAARPTRLWKSIAVSLATVLFVVGGAVAPTSAVTNYTLNGWVYLAGSGAAPVGDVRVQYTVHGQAHNPADVVELVAPGYFTIPNLPSGKVYDIFFEYVGAAGYASAYNNTESSVPVNSFSFDAGSVWPVAISGSVATLDSTYLWRHGTVTGVVTLGVGGPHAQAGEVAVRALHNGGSGDVWSPTVLTDANGAFSIPDLSASQVYQLYFDYLPGGAFFDAVWKRADGYPYFYVDAPSNTVKDITLLPPGTVSGHVYLGNTSTPAPAGSVTVSLRKWASYSWTDYPASMVVDAAGAYHFEGLPEGSYSLKFLYSGSDYRQTSYSATFPSPGDSVRDVTIPPLFTLSGVVHWGDSSTNPKPGEVEVRLHPRYDSSTTTGSAMALADGSWSISGVLAGDYTLQYVYKFVDGYYPQYGHPIPAYNPPGFITVSGDTTGLAGIIPLGNVVSGTVVDGAGAPIANAGVNVRDFYSGLGYNATTQADGSWFIRGLPDWAEYVVNLHKDGYQGGYVTDPDAPWPIMKFSLTGSSSVVLDPLVLYHPASVSGSIGGATPAEFTSGYVTARLYRYDDASDEWIYYRSATPTTAAYSWTDLVPGAYAVLVEYSGPRGYSQKGSSVYEIEESDAVVFSPVLAPAPPLYPATLVRIGSGSTVYLLDGYERLVPVPSVLIAADLGISTTVRSVSTQLLADYGVSSVPASAPLTNVVACYDYLYFASQGQLWEVTSSGVGGFPVTVLSDDTCSELHGAPRALGGPLVVRGASGTQIYVLAGGTKRPVASMSKVRTASTGVTPAPLIVNDYWLASVPVGASVTPWSPSTNMAPPAAGRIWPAPSLDRQASPSPAPSWSAPKHNALVWFRHVWRAV